VDLSHFDNVHDWDAVQKFGILGVINKATEGPGLVDRTYAIRRKPASTESCTAPIISSVAAIQSLRRITSSKWH